MNRTQRSWGSAASLPPPEHRPPLSHHPGHTARTLTPWYTLERWPGRPAPHEPRGFKGREEKFPIERRRKNMYLTITQKVKASIQRILQTK